MAAKNQVPHPGCCHGSKGDGGSDGEGKKKASEKCRCEILQAAHNLLIGYREISGRVYG